MSVFVNEGRYQNQQIIKKTTIDLIFENQLSENFNTSIGLVFGITRKEDTWFHKKGVDGVLHWGGYWNTNFFADNNEKVIALIYKQTQNTNESSWNKLIEIIYD